MDSAFSIRGLEIHNARMWRWSAIRSALDFMGAQGLNTLILHQNDLIDRVVLPPSYISPELMYTRWPILRSTLASNRLYMTEVVAAAQSAGIQVLFEVKELWFPDEILELRPDLRSEDGGVCPTHPFWEEFLRGKIAELLVALPELGGVIVSPATRESKATIATRSCTCARCQATEPVDWYERILRAMHDPLAERGKTLVVRDFAYTAQEQSVLLAAAQRVSPDIVMALKNVPHDFWPTFPDNPAIGGGSDRPRQWVEFDVLGQYCGLGVVPCSLVDDLRSRLLHCAKENVSGVWFRTDWELINDMSAFNSLNMVNLYAGAMLSHRLDTPTDDIYSAWASGGIVTALQAESMQGIPEVPSAPGAVSRLRDLLQGTWPIIERAMYTRGHVFQYSSKISPSLDDFFYVPERYHSREQWDAGSWSSVAVTPENVDVILAEKAEAGTMVRALRASLDVSELGLSDRLTADLTETFDLFTDYVDLYRHVVSAGFLAALALRFPDAAHAARALAAADELTRFRAALEGSLAQRPRYPFYVYWLFDMNLLHTFETDIHRRLGEVEGSSRPSTADL
jgi:hypothetical protein